MQTEVTTSNASAGGVAAEADGFGTRPSRERPHSIRLDGGPTGPDGWPVSRGLDVLLGVGIGAAAMYYLDPAAGSHRRARASRVIARAGVVADQARTKGDGLDWSPTARLVVAALGTALTILGGRRRDAVGAAVGVLGSALLAGGARNGRRTASERSSTL
jgi:hypothetical protein